MTKHTYARIMVVDDDKDGLEVLKPRLTHAGYEVETAIASTKPRVQFTHLRFFYVRKRSTVNYAVF